MEARPERLGLDSQPSQAHSHGVVTDGRPVRACFIPRWDTILTTQT